MSYVVGFAGFIVWSLVVYFIGRNRGKAAVARENAQIAELNRQLSIALEKGGDWAKEQWGEFLAWLKARYAKL